MEHEKQFDLVRARIAAALAVSPAEQTERLRALLGAVDQFREHQEAVTHSMREMCSMLDRLNKKLARSFFAELREGELAARSSSGEATAKDLIESALRDRAKWMLAVGDTLVTLEFMIGVISGLKLDVSVPGLLRRIQVGILRRSAMRRLDDLKDKRRRRAHATVGPDLRVCPCRAS